MKYRLPPGCAGVSHAGDVLEVTADACVDADPVAVALLAPHGIVPAGQPVPGGDAKTADGGAAQGKSLGTSSGRASP